MNEPSPVYLVEPPAKWAGERRRQEVKVTRAKKEPRTTELEAIFEQHVRAFELPEPEREVTLVPGRRFRCDFVWRERKLVVEVEGGTWANGAHIRPVHFESDCEKYNELALMGYTVLRFTGDMVRDGRAIQFVLRAFGREE